MKKLIATFVLLSFTTLSFGQITLQYDSQLEKEVFEGLNSKVVLSDVDLLLAAGKQLPEKSSRDVFNKLEVLYASIEKAGIDKKPEKKKVKIIFDQVHAMFFKRYQEVASFEEIFKNGTYNCVSASALYALVKG